MNDYLTSSDPTLDSTKENGMVLLGTVLILSLVMGLLVWGTLVMTNQGSVLSYRTNNMNQARTAALMGVSAFQQYIQQQFGTSGNSNAVSSNLPVGSTATANLAQNLPMAATVSAVVTTNTFGTSLSSNGIPGQIVIKSQGSSGLARATAVAVFSVKTSGVSTGQDQGNIPINLSGNTQFRGNVQLIGGSNSSLATKGEINANGNFEGFNTIASTQAMTIQGNSSSGNLFSDQDITISGSGNYGSLKSLENITISGSVNAQLIQTNGTTTLDSSSQASSITSIGDVNLKAGTMVDNLETDGNVNSSNSMVDSAQVQGNYTENSAGSAASGEVGGSLTFPSWNQAVRLTPVPGLIVPITPLTSITLTSPTINAAAMEGLANFAFNLPPSNASSGIVATVFVQNENGIPNGTYYLYDSNGNNDYLVTNPEAPSTTNAYKIGNGYSAYNADISYRDGTWTLQGNNGVTSDIAPGVLWFSGNVKVADGNYLNSIIATGNISTSGNSQVSAVNYAGGLSSNEVCADTGYFNSSGAMIDPSNFCGSSDSDFNAASVGNIALLAGANVALGSNFTVYGDVIAGNVLKTGGNTLIYGYLTSGGMLNGQISGDTNSFSGNTIVNISKLPPTFVPKVPTTFSNTSSSTTATTGSLVLQSLYWE